MANDFLSKYQSKASDDLQTIAQQTPTAPVQPAAEKPVADSAAMAAAVAQSTPEQPADAKAEGAQSAPAGMNFAAPAPSGFVPPASRTASAGVARTAPATRSKLPMYIGIAVAAVLAIVLAVFLLGRGKEVPNMANWSASEAELWANENSINLRVDELFSDDITAGKVLSQLPAAGERIGKGEFLTVTVSGGPDLSVMVPVPDVMNMTMAEVEAWADENYMTTVRITTQTSDTVASGKVISFTVNDNTVLEDEIRRDTPFYVIFSKGKPVGEAVEVPNFLTMSVLEAEAFALEKEITLTQTEEFSETVAEGNVIRQDIKAGETVYAGDSIAIVVSKGKEILVPDFASLSRELAEATASGLGIQTLIEETYATAEKDVLLSQSVKAGTLYQEGDIVVLQYSMGNTFAVPNFIGQTEADVYAWRDGLNADGANISVVVTHTDNSAAKGTILEQSHKNESVTLGEKVYVIASEGQPVIVPSFVQTASGSYSNIITKADVIAACDTLGLIPMFVEESASGRLPGEVWYQSLAAGSEAKAGDAITIKVVPANAAASVSVPSFTGKSISAVKATSGYSNFAITYQDESGAALAEKDIGASDTIIAQSVVAGSSVKAGYAIVLTVEVYIAPMPTEAPAAEPVAEPVATPTVAPTAKPTATVAPTVAPTAAPTVAPAATSTATPTTVPTAAPV